MCGIFGGIADNSLNISHVKKIAKLAQQRGKDSSGIIYFEDTNYSISRSDYSIMELFQILLKL